MTDAINSNSVSDQNLATLIQSDLDSLKATDMKLIEEFFQDVKKILEALILYILMNMSPSHFDPGLAQMLEKIMNSMGNAAELAMGLKQIITWVQENPDAWNSQLLSFLDQVKQALSSNP